MIELGEWYERRLDELSERAQAHITLGQPMSIDPQELLSLIAWAEMLDQVRMDAVDAASRLAMCVEGMRGKLGPRLPPVALANPPATAHNPSREE